MSDRSERRGRGFGRGGRRPDRQRNGASGGDEAVNRRPRLGLFKPTEPKYNHEDELEVVQAPNTATYQAEVAKIDEALKPVLETYNAKKAVVDEKVAKRQELRKQLSDLEQRDDSAADRKKKLQDEAEDLLAQIAAAEGARNLQRAKLAEFKSQLAIHDINTLNDQVAQLELKLQTGGFANAQMQRQLSDQSRALRSQRELVRQYQAQAALIESSGPDSAALRQRHRECIQQQQQQANLQEKAHKEVRELARAERKANAAVEAAMRDMAGVQQELSKLEAEKNRLKLTHDKQKAKFDEYMAKYNFIKTNRLRNERRAKEEERRELEQSGVEFDEDGNVIEKYEPRPFEREVALVDDLTKYFNRLLGKNTSSSESVNKSSGVPLEQLGDRGFKGKEVVALPQKKKGPQTNMVVNKKKAPKEEPKEAKEGKQVLSHVRDVWEWCAIVGVSVPATSADLPAALEALGKQKEVFLQKQQDKENEKARKEEAKQAKLEAFKKSMMRRKLGKKAQSAEPAADPEEEQAEEQAEEQTEEQTEEQAEEEQVEEEPSEEQAQEQDAGKEEEEHKEEEPEVQEAAEVEAQE